MNKGAETKVNLTAGLLLLSVKGSGVPVHVPDIIEAPIFCLLAALAIHSFGES